MDAEAENLYADAGYSGKILREGIVAAGYEPHVRPRGEEKMEKRKNPLFKARRWRGRGQPFMVQPLSQADHPR